LTLGSVALDLAACAPTPPRTDAKPTAAAVAPPTAAPAAPAATSAPAAAAPTQAPAGAPKPTEAPAAAAKPTEAAKPAAVATTAPANVKRGGKLVFGLDVNPVGLDPATTVAFGSVQVYQLIYMSLGSLDYATNKVIPDLAESWRSVVPQAYEDKVRQG
jgi:ABC-type transport system substrate-binding protein